MTTSESHRAGPARGRRTLPLTSQALRWAVVVVAGAATVLLAVPSRAATTFAPAGGSPYPTGPTPGAVVAGDFNGDGKADLATANTDSNTVTVLLGDGAADPAFTSTELPVAEYPYGIALADLNGDGHADLVTGHYYDYVTVLLGDGNGGFTEAPGSPLNLGGYPYHPAIGDFNGDAKPDLAVSDGSSGEVKVLLGNGDGGFAPAPGSPFHAGESPAGQTVSGDVNGDGKLDLVNTHAAEKEVWILLGDGAGSFTAANASPVVTEAPRPYAVVIADVNGDTKPDLVTTHDLSGGISVLLGDGAAQPTFTATDASPISTGGNTAVATAIADVDGDGKVDALLSTRRATTCRC